MKSKIISLAFAFFILISFFSVQVLAASEKDVLFHGTEVDNIITFISSILAIILFIFTFIAYKRTGRSKLIYVAIAFLLFAVKGFIQTSDMFITYNVDWISPVANIFDFAILLLFFFGIIKK
jgi:hypothetical protein